jgi:hypothetical protein
LWHRASYVFVVGGDGGLCVQTRTMEKDYCPGCVAYSHSVTVLCRSTCTHYTALGSTTVHTSLFAVWCALASLLSRWYETRNTDALRMLDPAAGGVVGYGETFRENALREVQ